jgi:hypothetical protein
LDQVSIIQPLDGDCYVLEGAGRSIIFRARTAQPLEEVTWFLNGQELGSTGPPYELRWLPVRGLHQVMAVGPGGRGDSITIKVE